MVMDGQETINIYIIGYYGHNNMGDCQYETTFTYFLNTFLPKNDIHSYNILFVDCDKIKLYSFIDTDIIILGGGDVLNEYFLDQIIFKFKNKKNKILSISVGIPYINFIINTNKLNIIDYIFVRTKQDIELFKEYFNTNRIFYLPDISFYLPYINTCETDVASPIDNILSKLKSIKSNKQIVAITLSRHIYNSKYKNNYDNIIQTYSKFIINLLSMNYHIVFLPFNTNKINSNENDIIIHSDIIQYINQDMPHVLNNLTFTNIDFKITSEHILQLYDCFYATVPMRFHACLFTIYKNVPMVPVFTTRKIHNLLLDIDYPISYELSTNDIDIPNEIDENILMENFSTMVNNYTSIVNNLRVANDDFAKCFTNSILLPDLIINKYIKVNDGLNCNHNIDVKIGDVFEKIQKIAIDNGYTHFTKVTNPNLQDIIVKIVSYSLTTKTINSIYNYGLKEKMFNQGELFNYYKEWRWIINDNANKLYNGPKLR